MIRFFLRLAIFLAIPFAIYGLYVHQTRGPVRRPLSFEEFAQTLQITDSTLLRVLRELEHPSLTQKSAALEMVRALAPTVTFHPEEHYFPTDPVAFVDRSELRNRSISPDAIPFKPSDLQSGFASFELNPSRIDKGSSTFDQAPTLWRLGHGPVVQELQPTVSNADALATVRILLEYWFHYDFNDAHMGGPFNHEGDWESVAIVVELTVEKNQDASSGDWGWTYRPIAAFLSQHEYGEWICMDSKGDRKNLPVVPRLTLASALGTHATYSAVEDPGIHFAPAYIDRTGNGSVWETSLQLRPLVLEPYYGYEGHWGSSHWFEYNRGPEAPNPRQKTIPKRRPKWEGKALAQLRKRCAL